MIAHMANLCEITHSMTPRVDREAGVIRGVKVLGRTSKNGREYSDKALSEAAKLYDHRDVNLNHPPRDKAGQERPVEAMFGWLESVEVKDDGVYADLHYATSHPMAPAIAEIASKNPMRLGLSHNAEGTVAKVGGKNVVESIQSVKSVDLVQTPATVAGLFESERETGKTCRAILEDYTGDTLPPAPGMDDPVEMPEAPPKDDTQAEAKAALTQVFSAALMAGGDLKSILAQVVALASAMMGSMPEEAPEVEASDDSAEMEDESTDDTETPAQMGNEQPEQPADEANPFMRGKKMAEAAKPKESELLTKLVESVNKLESRLNQQEARESAVALLEAANVEPVPARIQAIMRAADDAERAELVESFPRRERNGRGPRPAVGVALTESAGAVKYPETLDSFVAAIR